MSKPKILVLDIETSPIISYTWGLFDQNVGLNQIVEDWHLLSYAAKWLDEDKVYYDDQSKAKDIRNDKELLKGIWKLMDEADIVLGQNSKRFDVKKLNARFIINEMTPPSPFRQIDTLSIAKKHFALTSNKLEYMSKTLCTENKKSSHKKFAGFDLWKECLKGNKHAWQEMKDYNIRDVLSTEELYKKLQPWDSGGVNLNVYNPDKPRCNCGSTKFVKNGYNWSNNGKYARYKCASCKKHHMSKENLLSKEERSNILK